MRYRSLSWVLVLSLLFAPLVACTAHQEAEVGDEMRDAGETIEEAADDVGDAIEDAGDAIEEAADDAADDIDPDR